ncbi:recombinase RecT [Limosilactobacillus reuteri]|uniref:RecT protein n=2 Tax=Limosilactobacillus reuteri TaxID=1598 RepID=A5VJQ0_LIMRD|nr:RecT family recombinase [Limosilactobacillus reuteri]AYN56715.1 recombinase [Lactobacillus phage LR1]ABQ83074.1 RecT protein [Limosilactobacillus reuteri subsp. reuteri]AKP01053.1 RecT protein [Limosilactobacillus reuteri]EEI08396.1 recombinase, phage RecT family [Limosilactobacillus reuteri MM2-3]EGC15207.1 recombinase, phage RecT family [Limosilactobacillus reuteri MM4-1A]
MTNQVAQQQKPTKLTDLVLDRVKQMQDTQDLSLPKNYNASNALNAAFLELQKVQDRNHRPALEVCSHDSIVKSLLDMTLQGLSPAKDQCYFIVYGNELQMQRSYFGTVAAVKRLDGVKKVRAEVVHEKDDFEIGANEDMELVVKRFVPKFENQDNQIIGAFAMIKTDEGTDFTVMTKKEIDQSWAQTRQKNNKVQQNFSQEMAKRTVLNRAAKMFINTSDDSDLLTGAINDTTSNEYDDERRDVTPVEDEKQSTDKLLEGFQKSQEAKAKGVSNDGNSNEGKETSEEVADGQTELFSEGTIKPADEADS